MTLFRACSLIWMCMANTWNDKQWWSCWEGVSQPFTYYSCQHLVCQCKFTVRSLHSYRNQYRIFITTLFIGSGCLFSLNLQTCIQPHMDVKHREYERLRKNAYPRTYRKEHRSSGIHQQHSQWQSLSQIRMKHIGETWGLRWPERCSVFNPVTSAKALHLESYNWLDGVCCYFLFACLKGSFQKNVFHRTLKLKSLILIVPIFVGSKIFQKKFFNGKTGRKRKTEICIVTVNLIVIMSTGEIFLLLFFSKSTEMNFVMKLLVTCFSVADFSKVFFFFPAFVARECHSPVVEAIPNAWMLQYLCHTISSHSRWMLKYQQTCFRCQAHQIQENALTGFYGLWMHVQQKPGFSQSMEPIFIWKSEKVKQLCH